MRTQKTILWALGLFGVLLAQCTVLNSSFSTSSGADSGVELDTIITQTPPEPLEPDAAGISQTILPKHIGNG
jgi:hypothetical protein